MRTRRRTVKQGDGTWADPNVLHPATQQFSYLGLYHANGVGEFGEAHFIAVSPKGDLWVADSVNRAVQKFVKK